MGLCKKCKEFVAPDFMMDENQCAFCFKGENVIFGPNGERYSKEEVVKDYKILLGNLKDAQAVKDAALTSVLIREGLK